jgi:hypothetical protein
MMGTGSMEYMIIRKRHPSFNQYSNTPSLHYSSSFAFIGRSNR